MGFEESHPSWISTFRQCGASTEKTETSDSGPAGLTANLHFDPSCPPLSGSALASSAGPCGGPRGGAAPRGWGWVRCHTCGAEWQRVRQARNFNLISHTLVGSTYFCQGLIVECSRLLPWSFYVHLFQCRRNCIAHRPFQPHPGATRRRQPPDVSLRLVLFWGRQRQSGNVTWRVYPAHERKATGKTDDCSTIWTWSNRILSTKVMNVTFFSS